MKLSALYSTIMFASGIFCLYVGNTVGVLFFVMAFLE